MRDQPDLGGSRYPPHLLARDHLERVATLRPALRLHLAEDDCSAAADDEIELVAACPGVRGEDPVAAQPVVPERPPLSTVADRTGASSRR